MGASGSGTRDAVSRRGAISISPSAPPTGAGRRSREERRASRRPRKHYAKHHISRAGGRGRSLRFAFVTWPAGRAALRSEADHLTCYFAAVEEVEGGVHVGEFDLG